MTEFDHYNALLFDCDGTLADTMPAHWQAWQNFGKETGIILSEKQFYDLAGVPTYDIIDQLTGHKLTPHKLKQLSATKEDFYLADLDHVKPLPKVYEVVQSYLGQKPMAVVTGSTRHVVTKTLEALGLSQIFPVVICADDVKNPKPAPDTFLMAAQELKVDPKTCVVFEDADPGIQGAKAAGMDIVDVRIWKS